MKNTIKIVVEREVPFSRIADLLTSALEGGSNYWYMITDKIEPKAWTFGSWSEWKPGQKSPYFCDVPLNEGGALLINDENADDPEIKTPVRLDLETIEKGLQKWAKDANEWKEERHDMAHPHHWADFLAENDDAITADVFLQYCVFGKVIYG